MECAEVRDNVRKDIIESRQHSRDKVLSSKRKTLEDIVNLGRNVTDAEVALIGHKLKTKSAVQIEDLALLKLAFVQNATNGVAFLKVKGALHALVRELSRTTSNYQLVAAECCCNLALGDSKTCFQVAKAAGPYLIALLSGYNYNLISVSVWALGNLVGSDEKTWRIVHAQGFLGKLLQLITEHEHDPGNLTITDIQQNSFTALSQLLRVGGNLLTKDEAEAVAGTIGRLNKTSGKALRVCQFLLSCLNGTDQILLEHKVHLKCLQFMEKTELTEVTVSEFTPALRTVANLVAELSGLCCLDVFDNWPLFQGTVQKVLSSSYPHLVRELSWLLGNLMNHPSQEAQTYIAQELLGDFELYISQLAFFNG